jgi:hypothetical protein
MMVSARFALNFLDKPAQTGCSLSSGLGDVSL